MGKRLGIISFLTLLMIAGFVIVNRSVEDKKTDASLHKGVTEKSPERIYSEEKVFERSSWGYKYKDMDFDSTLGRETAEYNGQRAYPGAPPTIPHPLSEEATQTIGGQSCLKCHENGGYVDQFNAYAPVTPHKEMLNCRQCHVPQNTTSVFKESNFHKSEEPLMGQNALPGSPPMIPHDIQLKENCLACHAGPGARKEIRVSHPERVNCRQCHVPNTARLESIPQEFTRTNSLENIAKKKEVGNE